jgi:hypothetical protein
VVLTHINPILDGIFLCAIIARLFMLGTGRPIISVTLVILGAFRMVIGAAHMVPNPPVIFCHGLAQLVMGAGGLLFATGRLWLRFLGGGVAICGLWILGLTAIGATSHHGQRVTTVRGAIEAARKFRRLETATLVQQHRHSK